MIRCIIPDSHGEHIDWTAAEALCRDLKKLGPSEIVLLGDHLDCGGIFSTHAKAYTNEITESYDDDCKAANAFLDRVQRAAPKAEVHYLEGNHEARVERWATSTFTSKKDADKLLETYGPAKALRLKERGIRYYRRDTMYGGISIPGTIRLGKCFFTHGIGHGTHAAATHLSRFGASVVFGHTHRSQAFVSRTVSSDAIGAWSVGCLTKLQPLYMHTTPTNWVHGYGVQDVRPSGRFMHYTVPIVKGESLLGGL